MATTGDEQTPTTQKISQDDLTDRIRKIEKRDSATADEPVEANGAAAPGAPPVAAAPAADTPTGDAIDWGAEGLQVDHKMLRGKKPEDVVKILQNAQDKIRKSGEELALLRRAGQSSSAPTQSQQATADNAVNAAPQDDPRVLEYETAVFTDQRRALKIATELALEQFEAREAQRRQQIEQQAQTNTAINAGMAVVQKIIATGLPKEEAEFRVISAIAPELNRMAEKAYREFGGGTQDAETEARAAQAYRDVWKSEDSYLEAYDRIYGTSVAAPRETVSAPNVTPRADPPGARAAIPTQVKPATVRKQSDPETERAIARLSDGLSKDAVDRISRRVAARGV